MKSSPQASEPTLLKHCLQGWPPPGPNAFRWEDGKLIYMLPAKADRDFNDWDKAMIPTANQWAKIWKVCDKIDVWSWPPTLGDRNVIDGLQWSLELKWDARSVASRGQIIGSPPGFEAKLMRLHRALQAMTGWRSLNRPWWRFW